MQSRFSFFAAMLLIIASIVEVFCHPDASPYWDIDLERQYGFNASHHGRRLTDDLWEHWRRELRDDYENAEFFTERPGVEVDQHHRRLAHDHWQSLKHFVEPEKLTEVIAKWKDYKLMSPFPHMYIDDLFPLDVLHSVIAEIPDKPPAKDGCIQNGQRCFNSGVEKSKNAIDNDIYHGPATAALFAFLKSSMFIKFLEKLTGIEDIIPDPHYRGAGIHQTLTGGFLDIHADFNRYQRYDLHRRVNVLLYLNPNWNESWGGDLELWSRDLKRCEVKLAPTLGRMVVFSSTDFSYHGHQEPLRCPEDRSRRSLAMYYYTRSRPASECLKGNCFNVHTTLFQTTACPTCTSDCGNLRTTPEFNKPHKAKSWFSWFS